MPFCLLQNTNGLDLTFPLINKDPNWQGAILIFRVSQAEETSILPSPDLSSISQAFAKPFRIASSNSTETVSDGLTMFLWG